MHRWLSTYLQRPQEAPLDEARLTLLEQQGLGAFVYSALPPQHPLRPRLKPRVIAASARHAALRLALQRLFAAWNAAGITPLLFKGFYLAEFIYPLPAARSYGDVDVLIAETQGKLAALLARQQGWLELWSTCHPPTMLSLHDASYCGHELVQLYHPELGVQLDVHRRILHNLHNQLSEVSQQERITAQALAASRPQRWGGVTIATLAPVDSLLVGLVLNRCWSGDGWALRPHDYLDFQLLQARFKLTRTALEQRAAELGCRRTLACFLTRCNPLEARLTLTPPGFWRRQVYHLRILAERRHRGVAALKAGLRELPEQCLELVRAWPLTRRALCQLRYQGGLRPLPGEGKRLLSYREWQALRRGVRRALRLQIGRRHPHYPAAYLLALHDGLTRRGCPAALQGEGDGATGYRLIAFGRCLVDGHNVDDEGVMLLPGPDRAPETGFEDCA